MPAQKLCDDPERPLCRHFYRKKCRRGDRCRFYHPKIITPIIRKEGRREPGMCYCGSYLLTIPNRTPYRGLQGDEDRPLFIVVCSNTGRSMKRCR